MDLLDLLQPVWPDWAIYWTLGNLLKPLATINLPKSSTFLGIFCKGVKIYHFWATFIDFWQFFQVTLVTTSLLLLWGGLSMYDLWEVSNKQILVSRCYTKKGDFATLVTFEPVEQF